MNICLRRVIGSDDMKLTLRPYGQLCSWPLCVCDVENWRKTGRSRCIDESQSLVEAPAPITFLDGFLPA